MWSLFRPPGGADQGMPRTVKEMREWADTGLIPDWKPDTLTDEVVANILKAVREHLERQ